MKDNALEERLLAVETTHRKLLFEKELCTLLVIGLLLLSLGFCCGILAVNLHQQHTIEDARNGFIARLTIDPPTRLKKSNGFLEADVAFLATLCAVGIGVQVYRLKKSSLPQ